MDWICTHCDLNRGLDFVQPVEGLLRCFLKAECILAAWKGPLSFFAKPPFSLQRMYDVAYFTSLKFQGASFFCDKFLDGGMILG